MSNIKKEKLKRKLCMIIFLGGILVTLFAFGISFFGEDLLKKDEQLTKENENFMFNVNKIQYYSNVSAISNKTTYQEPEWNLNLYQYTDIAIYIERLKEFENESYIKNLYIDNIEITEAEKGEQKIYYLNPLYYGKDDNFEQNNDYEITDKLEYNLMNYANEEDDVKYSIPIFFQDCSNPITLRYLNSNIVEDYIISTSEQIKFNGSLLKNKNVSLEDIETNITLSLNIITETGDTHNIELSLDIPLSNQDLEIFDGAVTYIEDNLENEF